MRGFGAFAGRGPGRRGAGTVVSQSAGGYNVVDRLAYIAGLHADFAGVTGPTAPTLTGTATVSTLAALNTALAVPGNDVTLTASIDGVVSFTASDVRLTFAPGVTNTRSTDQESFTVAAGVRRLKVIDWSSNTGGFVWGNPTGPEDVHFYNATMDDTANSTWGSASLDFRGKRILMERCTLNLHRGVMFLESACENVWAANCRISCLVDPGNENAFRSNGADLCGVFDSWLSNPIKNNLRAYSSTSPAVSGGRIMWLNLQVEGGGINCDSNGITPKPMTSHLYIRGLRLYRNIGTGNLISIPYLDGASVDNTLVTMYDNIFYCDENTAGTGIVPSGTGSPAATWPTVADAATSFTNGNENRAYTAPPAWGFHTTTPA